MSAENGVSSPFWSQHSSPSPTLISSFVLCTHILHATAGLGKIRIFILQQKTEFFSPRAARTWRRWQCCSSPAVSGDGVLTAVLQCCRAVTLDLTLSCPLHSCSLHSCCTKLPPHCTALGQHRTEVKCSHYYHVYRI